jgi:hypothetical protein
MRQGITTRYLGPTNAKGSRIKAIARKRDSWGPEQAVTVDRQCDLGIEANHTRAAMALAKQLDWKGLWVGGGNSTQDGFHYVCLSRDLYCRFGERDVKDLGKVGEDWFYIP